jgi:hypothetical protein
MRKAILIAAVAAVTLFGATFAGVTPVSANQVVAQSSMAGEDGMKAAMDKLQSEMSAMKMSGNADKDYMATMKMLMSAMKSVNHAEMMGGKDAKMMKHAKDVDSAFKAPNFSGFGV